MLLPAAVSYRQVVYTSRVTVIGCSLHEPGRHAALNRSSAFQVLSSLETGQGTLHSAPVRIYDRSGTSVASLHAGADLSEANLNHDIRVALEN